MEARNLEEFNAQSVQTEENIVGIKRRGSLPQHPGMWAGGVEISFSARPSWATGGGPAGAVVQPRARPGASPFPPSILALAQNAVSERDPTHLGGRASLSLGGARRGKGTQRGS